MTGPTVAGSIVAKLKLDSSDWDAKLAAARAQADELGRHDPHIRVDVDSGKAIADLAAAKAAEDALTPATGRLTTALKNQNDTNASGITRWKLIAAAIAALVPLLSPLAGYAVGVAGALAGMGAAGVLAVIGIKQAMDAGNLTGQAYSSGLQALKGDLNGLASTSANAMLGSFRQAVALINADMPSLNSQISVFSRMLGQVGTTVLSGVLNSFKILNPLFVQAGEYVQDLADGFKKWTEDGGLKKFADYAQQSLPKVADTLGALATAILHIIEATAPLGVVTLGVLTAISEAISGIPIPVLTSLVAVAGSVFVAISAWKTLAPTIQAVAGALKSLGAAQVGMLGLAGAAVLVTQAIANFGAMQLGTLVYQLTGMSTAFDKVNAAISSGKLGTATNDYRALKSQLDATRGSLGGFAGTVIDASNSFDKMGPVVSFFAGPMQSFLQATVGKSSKAVDQYKAAVDAAKQATQQAADAQGISVGAYNSLTAALDAQKNSTNLLKNAFDLLNGTNLTVAQSQTAMAAANNQVATSLTTNGLAIDGNSDAAIKNQQAIQAAAQAAQANATAITTQTGSTNAGTQAFAASKTALEQQLAAQGNLTPAVQAYIDKLYQIPPELATKLSVDNAAANAAIADTASRLAALSGAIASVGAGHLATTGNGYVPSENGNMFVQGAQQAFADGGFPTGIYAGRPGGIHKFAEQQTGWEAYISGKPGQESRNAGIALKALGKLGYELPTRQPVQSAPVTVSLEGATILLSVDGQQMTGVIQKQIVQANEMQGASLSNGVRPLA